MNLADASDAELAKELFGWFLTLVGIGLGIVTSLGAWAFWSMKSHVQNAVTEAERRVMEKIEERFADSKMTQVSLTTHDRQIAALYRRLKEIQS